MRLFRSCPAWLACLALTAGVLPARAETRPDPLRLIPAQADFVFKVERPQKLLEVFQHIDVLKDFGKLAPIREAYDSTNFRRFYQLITFFEKQLGAKWPELVDRLAGNGAAVGVHFGSPGPVVLLVVQGKDEKLVRKFFRTGMQVVEQELARQEARVRPQKDVYRDVEVVNVPQVFCAAAAGPNLLVSNNAQALKAAIDLYRDGGHKSIAGNPSLAEARRVLPADPLAWAWLNFDPIHKLPQLKPIFEKKQNDVFLTFFAGPLLDIARRSPFLCAGLYANDNSLTFAIRFPRGLEGMSPGLASLVAAGPKTTILPVLEPKNVIFSTSYYYDLAQFWEKRKELLNPQQVATFERADKQSGLFLAGTRLSQLLTTSGPHQRIVIVQQTSPGYKTRPAQVFPAGAFVIDMRDPDKFGKGMDTVLRAAALFAGGQANLKLVEEKRGKWTIVGYRFPEADSKDVGRLKNDVNGIRYNFSPCFVRVGNQFVISSTIELARELVDILDRETPSARGGKTTSKGRLYGTGGAAVLRVFKDQLLTQTILGRAVPPDEAEKEVNALTDLVARLGTLQISQKYARDSFHYNIKWKWAK